MRDRVYRGWGTCGTLSSEAMEMQVAVCQCLLLALALLCFSPGANCSYRLWIRQASNEMSCRETPQGFNYSFISNCTMLPMNETVCNRAWDEFSGAFARKDPATVDHG